jgi:hypothetical protein
MKSPLLCRPRSCACVLAQPLQCVCVLLLGASEQATRPSLCPAAVASREQGLLALHRCGPSHAQGPRSRGWEGCLPLTCEHRHRGGAGQQPKVAGRSGAVPNLLIKAVCEVAPHNVYA